MAQQKLWLANFVASRDAWVLAHPRPDVHAQPEDVAAWLNAGGLDPYYSYPEWGWKVVAKSPAGDPSNPQGVLVGQLVGVPSTTLKSDAIAAVSLGDNDNVTWWQHPDGSWQYHHVWGESIGQIWDDVMHAVNGILQDAANIIGTYIQWVQIAVNVIPGLGNIVNEVVAAAEDAYDVLEGNSALAIAIDAAYHAALAAVPGAESLSLVLDPVVGVLKDMANGMNATTAAITEAVKNVPDTPDIGGVNPRSIASSLAAWVAVKLGLVKTS